MVERVDRVEVLPVPRTVVALDQLGDLSGIHRDDCPTSAQDALVADAPGQRRRRRSARAGAAPSSGRRRAGRGSARARSGPPTRTRRRAPRAPARTPRPIPRSRRRRGRAALLLEKARECRVLDPDGLEPERRLERGGRLGARAELGASRPAGRASRRAARARAAARPPRDHGSGGGAMPGIERVGVVEPASSSRAQLVEPRAREDPAVCAARRPVELAELRGATRRAPARARSRRSRRARRAPCARGSRGAAAQGRSRGRRRRSSSARSTTRSPRAATTGSARRSCAKRSPTRTTRASTLAVPWCTWTRGGNLGERGRARRRGDSSTGTRRLRRARRRAAARGARCPAARRRPAAPPRRARPARSCTCTLRTRTGLPPGSARSSSPSPTEPDQSVPVATVPIPRSVKTRSTYRRVGASARLALLGDGGERGAQLVEAGARARADRDDRRARHELLRLGARELERLVVDEVALRQRDDAALDPEQPQDREMLVRLRPRALVRVDHEQEEVDAGRAGDHRAHEALVPGHVDDGELRPVRQLERRVAEVDRDAALALLRQPVGVLAGQRLDERRLAVVDVPGGADRQRHRVTAAATSSTSPSRERPAVEQEPAVADDPDDGRLAGAQRRRERLLDRAREARQLGERQRAAADAARPSPRPCRRRAPPAAPRARAPTRDVLPQHAQHRDPLRRVEVHAQRPLERGERQLVGAHRAVQRMPAQPLDEVGAPDDDAGLRAAEQLVAGEADEVRAGGERLARGRLARRSSRRALRSRGRRAAAARAAARPRRARRAAALGEADDPEVRLVHAQQERRLGPDGAPRSRRRACGSSCRPRRAGRPIAPARRGCGSRRRSRPARRARRSPRGPRRAPRARAAPRRRCC